MGTIAALSIIDEVSLELNDASNTRWSQAELLDYLNAGQRQVVVLRPDANVSVSAVQLVAGSRQSIPADGVALLDITHNIIGGVDNKVVTLIEREIMDQYSPMWRVAVANADGTVDHYMFDGRDPTKFDVTPPAPAVPNSVQMQYAQVPADIVGAGAAGALNGTELIVLGDIYSNALAKYVKSRALAKNTDSNSSDVAQATAAYQSFLNDLGVGGKVKAEFNPNNNTRPFDHITPERLE